jgi:hypothetical protein
MRSTSRSGSPILHGDTVILDCDQTGKTSSLIAFDKATGEIRWEAKRPETSFAHSTPVIVKVGGPSQMLGRASGAIQGVDPASGKSCGGAPRRAMRRRRRSGMASFSATADAVEKRCASIRPAWAT